MCGTFVLKQNSIMNADDQSMLRGRLVAPGLVRNERGNHPVRIQGGDFVSIGDIVEVDAKGNAKILTPNRSLTTHWPQRILDPDRLHACDVRSRLEQGIREFFRSKGFREVRTPLLVPCPGMEVHIRPLQVTEGAYLPTSPEFAMKRLLVGGLEKIFQICPAFRLEPNSTTHHPEFTLLEWYRAYAGYEEIMSDVERMFAFLATRLFGEPKFRFQGRLISVEPPWPRLRVRDLFLEHAGVDLVKCDTSEKLARECVRLGLLPAGGGPDTGPDTWPDTWDDLYFRIWLNVIEPRLPAEQAVFVTRYPASQSALAVVDRDPDGSSWAKRFEVYAGGLELGNAFEELTDPLEQRKRFIEDMKQRERIYGSEFPPTPLDKEFLAALEEGMPPSGGIAMGVDRMVMLFADEGDIDRTLWLRSRPQGG